MQEVTAEAVLNEVSRLYTMRGRAAHLARAWGNPAGPVGEGPAGGTGGPHR